MGNYHKYKIIFEKLSVSMQIMRMNAFERFNTALTLIGA
jgi:hypothetical protein